MTTKQILLDLDGPAVDCHGDVLELHGIDRSAQETFTDYDMLTRFLAQHTPEGQDPWQLLGSDRDFWRNMTPQPWMSTLVSVCHGLAPTIICTKPLPYGSCAAGKLDWCLDHGLGCSIVRGDKSGAGKEALASPRHILIDDAEHQVDAFNAAGGTAILWPMPWNRKGSIHRYGLEAALREIVEAVHGG